VTRVAVVALLIVASHVAPAAAQERPIADLKNVPPAQQVRSVEYCRTRYHVPLGDGTARSFGEYDLAFKVDSGASGPKVGQPALVPTGRVGDRAFVVFADLEELRRTVQVRCRD
jgi:hypothetical protein